MFDLLAESADPGKLARSWREGILFRRHRVSG
jgi:hypothetical protein